MAISRHLSERITEHLDPEKSYRLTPKFDIGRDYIDERDELLLKDVDELLEKSESANDLLEWLPKIYSSSKLLFPDYPRDGAKIRDRVNEIVLKIASFQPGKDIGVQRELIKYVDEWIQDNNIKELAFNVCAKLLELRGTTATYKDDSSSLNIQHFIVKLDTKVHDLRQEVYVTLQKYFENLLPADQIRILEIFSSGFTNGVNVRFKGEISKFAFDEIDQSFKFLTNFVTGKKDTQINDPLFYDVLAKIFSVSERVSDYKDIGYTSENPKTLISLIEQHPHFSLFQSLFHPTYRYLSSGKELQPLDIIRLEVKSFSTSDQQTLVTFLKYAESQGAIYNSIKTFFRELGKENSAVAQAILQSQLSVHEGSFWYYAGHAIGILIQNPKYLSFTKRLIQKLSESDDTLEKKAVVDVLTELNPEETDTEVIFFCLNRLQEVLDSVNKRDRNNWHFKWSVAEAVESIFTQKLAKSCFEILGKCLEEVNGTVGNNQIIYDRVASTIFGLDLAKKLNEENVPELIKLLQCFLHSGANSTDVDTFYQVVAKYDTHGLIDFMLKKIEIKQNDKSSLDSIPFDWKFIFERLPENLSIEQRKQILKHLIETTLQSLLTYPLVLHLDRIWAALQKKVGEDLGYEVLSDALSKTSNFDIIDKLLYLLEEVEDYDNPKYWEILEKQIETGNRKLIERIHSVVFTGSFSSAQEDQRIKWLTKWTKSKNKTLVNFAESMLGSIEKLGRWEHE